MSIALAVVAVTVVVYVIKLFYDNISYWKSRGIPGPVPSLFYGNLNEMKDYYNPAFVMMKEWKDKYGPVYGYYDGWRKVLVINDLDMIQELFVKKFDDFYGRMTAVLAGDPDKEPRVHVFKARGIRWKRLRTLASPAFSSSSLKKIRPIVEDSARHLVALFEQHLDGDAVDAHNYFQEFTMDVISRLTMGQEKSNMLHNPYIDRVAAIFADKRGENILFTLAQIAPVLQSVVRPLIFLLGKLRPGIFPIADINTQIQKAIQKRIAENERGVKRVTKDYIDLFLEAADGSEIDDFGAEFARANVSVSKSMTEDEVIGQCLVFLFAGFDTTANSLSYALFHLARDERVRRLVQQEIDEHCTEEDITYDTINNLSYMDCVVKEALRLYPLAALANSRECMRETTLGDMKIEKGVFVAANPWTIHYDKKIWGEDADQFRPERWEDTTSKRHQMSWLSFGAGPRTCIGMRLAYLEEKMALAHLLRKFDVVAGPKTPEKLCLVGCLTTSPAEVPVYIRRRSFD